VLDLQRLDRRGFPFVEKLRNAKAIVRGEASAKFAEPAVACAGMVIRDRSLAKNSPEEKRASHFKEMHHGPLRHDFVHARATTNQDGACEMVDRFDEDSAADQCEVGIARANRLHQFADLRRRGHRRGLTLRFNPNARGHIKQPFLFDCPTGGHT
jgi:hypothetical protein